MADDDLPKMNVDAQDKNFTVHALETKLWLIHVIFEQGRGKGGVPKVWVSLPGVASRLETVIAIAVAALRAECADPSIGHGQDLMPPELDDVAYEFHKLLGGRIEKLEDIPWRTRTDGHNVASLVLTWGLPSEHLAQTCKRL